MTKRNLFSISRASWAILGCCLMLLFSSACSDSDTAPVETTTPPPAPDHSNQVAGGEAPAAPDVTIHWRAVDSTQPVDKSQSLHAELVNETDVEQTGRLAVIASGLDGRLEERPLANFRLAARAKQQVDLRVDDLPIQSDSSTSFAVVQAEVTRLDGFVLRVSTEPLYFHFQSGYGAAFFYGPEQVPQKAPRVAPGSVDVYGRVREANGTWTEISPASASTATPTGNDGAGKQGATSVVTTPPGVLPVEPSTADDSLVAAPGTTATYTLCGTWRAQFVDSGLGEDVLPLNVWQDVTASYAFAYVATAAGNLVWLGNLNVNGCTSLTLSTSTVYTMGVTGTSMTFSGGPIIDVYLMENTTRTTQWVSSAFTTPATGQTHTVRFTQNDDVIQTNVVAAAVLAAAARTNQGMPTGNHYVAEVHSPDCGNATNPKCPVAPGNVVQIGLNSQLGIPMTRWKFMIAHEFGHTAEFVGVGTFVTNYAWPDLPKVCGCAHVDDVFGKSHCMQSRGDTGSAQVEGFAHAFSARVFNFDGQNDGIFTHYKPFLSPYSAPNPTFNPPIGFRMLWDTKFMSNFCSAGSTGKGIELDWMQFFYKVTALQTPNRTSLTDLFLLYHHACSNGTSWSMKCDQLQGHSVNWTKLLFAAQELYGLSDARYLRFRDTGFAVGVNQ